jgi:hypothetical protein
MKKSRTKCGGRAKQYGPDRRGRAVALVNVGRLEAFAFQALALQLAGAAHGLGGFAGLALGRLFEVPAQLHLTENALALHLLLERLQGLIDIVVANENVNYLTILRWGRRDAFARSLPIFTNAIRLAQEKPEKVSSASGRTRYHIVCGL